MGMPARFAPFEHQARLRDFFATTPASPTWRGLLLYHSLGSGKTCTAILAATAAARAYGARRIVVMTQAALRPNYAREIEVCGAPRAEGTEAPTEFLAYNGLQHKRLAAMRAADFDGCVVVIDEVHNFCSRAATPGSVLRALYDLLMAASGARFVLLSGTPIINQPHEIAYAINLARGPMRRIELAGDDVAAHVDVASGVDGVEDARALPGGGALTLAVSPEAKGGEDDVVLRVREALRKAGAPVKSVRRRDAEALPTDPEEFDRLFLAPGPHGVMELRPDRRALFMRRLAGLVSHVDATADPKEKAKYPRFEGVEEVRLIMGAEQVKRYVVVRNQEIRQEKLAASFRGRDAQRERKVSQVYRAYSRAACDFCFPQGIERPYASKLRLTNPEADPEDVASLQKAYGVALAKAMDELRRRAPKEMTLRKGALGRLSCKFEALLPRLRDGAGKALVYSQFRTVEGLGALRIALAANGWREVVAEAEAEGGSAGGAPKPAFVVYPSDDAAAASAALDAFNAPDNLRGERIKVLLITQSGAEGISLKAVRDVHLLEPYWNDIRVQQVIGRAVRAGSHAELPRAERTVRAHLYLATLPASEYAREPELRRYDGSKSTDEAVHAMAAAKARVIDAFLGMMRQAAIDCDAARERCVAPTLPPEPDLRKDAARHVAQVVRKNGKKYVVVDGDVSTFYDYARYVEKGELEKISL